MQVQQGLPNQKIRDGRSKDLLSRSNLTSFDHKRRIAKQFQCLSSASMQRGQAAVSVDPFFSVHQARSRKAVIFLLFVTVTHHNVARGTTVGKLGQRRSAVRDAAACAHALESSCANSCSRAPQPSQLYRTRAPRRSRVLVRGNAHRPASLFRHVAVPPPSCRSLHPRPARAVPSCDGGTRPAPWLF